MNDKINLYRRNGKLIYIKMPEFNELAFVRELWGKKENMGEFGDVYSFPKEKWEMFYRKMVSPTDGKNFYCLIYDLNDKPIGEVSFHGYNSATKVARINIKIHYEHRKKGYGEEALRLLLEYYFYEFGGQSIIDSVKSDEGKSLLKKIGFEERTYSNGENGFKYFTDAIQPGGLYLLDEPENSLSAEMQLELVHFLHGMVRFYDCQFILSSHSPFILSLPNARIYNMDSEPVNTCRWTELPNVKIYRDFFNDHQSEF